MCGETDAYVLSILPVTRASLKPVAVQRAYYRAAGMSSYRKVGGLQSAVVSGPFISSILPHLTWPHLSRHHFIWTTVYDGWSQPRRTGPLQSAWSRIRRKGDKITVHSVRWNEVIWGEVRKRLGSPAALKIVGLYDIPFSGYLPKKVASFEYLGGSLDPVDNWGAEAYKENRTKSAEVFNRSGEMRLDEWCESS